MFGKGGAKGAGRRETCIQLCIDHFATRFERGEAVAQAGQSRHFQKSDAKLALKGAPDC